MHIPLPDRSLGESEWRTFVEGQGFGHLVAAGRGRDVPVVVPTQFVLEDDHVFLHLAAPNPIFEALAEQPRVVLSVAGDWAFIPSAWKAIDDEDPMLGIPTTYYAAVQLEGVATVGSEPAVVAAVLRRQLGSLQPDVPVADPELAHAARLRSIRAITIGVDAVRAKFKYGGNVDERHRAAVIERLAARAGPRDGAAADRAAQRMRQPVATDPSSSQDPPPVDPPS
jgi:transcriptional regulator